MSRTSVRASRRKDGRPGGAPVAHPDSPLAHPGDPPVSLRREARFVFSVDFRGAPAEAWWRIVGPNGAGKSEPAQGRLGMCRRCRRRVTVFGEAAWRRRANPASPTLPQGAAWTGTSPPRVIDVVADRASIRELGLLKLVRAAPHKRAGRMACLARVGHGGFSADRQIGQLSGGAASSGRLPGPRRSPRTPTSTSSDDALPPASGPPSTEKRRSSGPCSRASRPSARTVIAGPTHDLPVTVADYFRPRAADQR